MSRYPRRLRSLSKQDFKRVFRQSDRSSDASLVIMAGKNQLNISRLGLAISKKHLPRAVDRNRVKRQIRESFRQNVSTLPTRDIVVMSRPDIRRCNNRELRDALNKHWQKLVNKTGQ